MVEDFRKFIFRGNVIDLAIGVIIGAAFTAIINSLVNDIFMPIIGILIGGVNFEDLVVEVGEASINYGLFIQAVVNFLLIALILFFALRAVVALEKELSAEEEEAEEEKPEIPQDIQLLTEIRDLLSERSQDAAPD